MNGAATQREFPAAGWMLLSSALFACMVIAIRMTSQTLHAFEVAFLRNLFGLAFALPLLIRTGLAILRTEKLPLYFVRCIIGLISMLCGFWAIAHLPLAQAVAISYSTPIFVTVGAVLALGEVVRLRRWTAVVIGFIGVLVIVRPGAADFSGDSLIALAAAIASAAVAISIKILSRTEPADAIVLFTSLIWAPLSLIPALFVWEWPSAAAWGWGALSGLLGTIAHMCWTRALRAGEASALTPISFVQLPVVALFGWLLFDETLDAFTLWGSGIIFVSTVYIAHRESVLARQAARKSTRSSD